MLASHRPTVLGAIRNVIAAAGFDPPPSTRPSWMRRGQRFFRQRRDRAGQPWRTVVYRRYAGLGVVSAAAAISLWRCALAAVLGPTWTSSRLWWATRGERSE